MKTSRSVQTIACLSLLAAAASLVACTSGGEPSDPQDKLAAVRDAIKSPSGAVDATSMKGLSKLNSTIAMAKPIFDATSVVQSANAAGCLKGGVTSGSYDLSCATDGKVTGSLSFEAAGSASAGATQATVQMTFENACSDGVCVSGIVIVEAKVSQGSVATTVAFSADVTQGKSKTHLFFGEDLSVAGGTAAAKVAIFDSAGESYLLEASVGPSGSTYAVVGSNGSFECSVSDAGGKCTGSASFEF